MVGGRISRRSVRAQIGWMECLFDTLGRERKRGGEGKGRIKKELDRMEREKWGTKNHDGMESIDYDGTIYHNKIRMKDRKSIIEFVRNNKTTDIAQ